MFQFAGAFVLEYFGTKYYFPKQRCIWKKKKRPLNYRQFRIIKDNEASVEEPLRFTHERSGDCDKQVWCLEIKDALCWVFLVVFFYRKLMLMVNCA